MRSFPLSFGRCGVKLITLSGLTGGGRWQKTITMLVIGISGATCAGKTTISRALTKVLSAMNIHAITINQDQFYHHDDWPGHDKVLKGLVNFEVSSAFDNEAIVKEVEKLKLDDDREGEYLVKTGDVKETTARLSQAIDNFDRFTNDLCKILAAQSSKPTGKSVIILEGILIFNHQEVRELCDVKHFITLEKQICWERRQKRTYDPPDVPGYFEHVVWPYYLKNLGEIRPLDDVHYIDGDKPLIAIFNQVFTSIIKSLSK